MSMLGITMSTAPYNIHSLRVRTGRRFQVPFLNPSCLLATSKFRQKCRATGNHGLTIFSTSLEFLQPSSYVKMDMAAHGGVEPGVPLPSDPSPGSWKFWILGMVISALVPFMRNRWEPLLRLRDKVETVVETADTMADIVETVAEKVEEVAEDVADHLPEGGKLKKLATLVEEAAKETAEDAHRVDEFIDKLEEVEQEVESFFEPVADQDKTIAKESKD